MDDTAQNRQQPPQALEYEETPIIEPIKEEQPPISQSAPIPAPAVLPPEPERPSPKKKSGFFSKLLTFLTLLVLLAAGIYVGTSMDSWFPFGKKQAQPASPSAITAPTPTPISPTAGWLTYQVLSATTKQPIPDVSFKLPPSVPAPICDGASCISQGTYLPGGTRFTVAARGLGQSLNYIRGAIITDAGGRPFVTKAATVSGIPAFAFTGAFAGSTVGGYTFSQMGGVMIELSATTALEVNHFTPSGVTTDFTSDDTLFNLILTTFTFPASAIPTPTPTAIPTPTPVPVATSSAVPATSSGY
ncbi:hypothetical protein HY031_02280 [Candidatus Gottesmanbacteria bacterium]|nr:hypothetical protein [Candidatus Gottesmanbacteria bacterium]